MDPLFEKSITEKLAINEWLKGKVKESKIKEEMEEIPIPNITYITNLKRNKKTKERKMTKERKKLIKTLTSPPTKEEIQK